MVGVARLAGHGVEDGVLDRHGATWTRPGGAGGSAPGCWWRRPVSPPALGVDEIILGTEADNQAVLPIVLAAGLRGRIRMAGDQLTVRIPVRDLKPLPA